MANFGADLPAAIAARYDIITFDPRGFGYSTAIRCFPTMAAESKFLGGLSFQGVPVFPVGARQEAAAVRTWARFDARCARRNGSLLDHDTTADVARDMNLLRQAVGSPVLNYVGAVLRHRARRHLRQPVPRHDRAHGPGREPQPGRLDPPGRRAADLSSPGLGPSVRGGDAGLPGPVRQDNNLGVRVLRRNPGRDPRQVGHAAAPAPPASGHYRHPAADLHLRHRGRGAIRAAARGEPVAVRRQPAAATLGGLGRRPPVHGGQPGDAGPGQPARHRRDRAPGRLHRL